MKKFLLMFAAVAGVSFFALSDSAEASSRCYGHGGYYSRGYSPSYYNRGYRGGFDYRPGYRGDYYRPRPHYHSYDHGFYGGRRGYYGTGFGIQTRNFGLYIR